MSDKSTSWREAFARRFPARLTATPTAMQSRVAAAMDTHTTIRTGDWAVRWASWCWGLVAEVVVVLSSGCVVVLAGAVTVDVYMSWYMRMHRGSHCGARTELLPMRSNAADTSVQIMGVHCESSSPALRHVSACVIAKLSFKLALKELESAPRGACGLKHT